MANIMSIATMRVLMNYVNEGTPDHQWETLAAITGHTYLNSLTTLCEGNPHSNDSISHPGKEH